MNVRKGLVLVACVSAASLPSLAFAGSPWHPTNDDAGVSFHLDHLNSPKTRSQVIAELAAARKDGSLYRYQRELDFPQSPPTEVRPAKSRQQVIDELRQQTPLERRTRFEDLAGG